MHQLIIVKRSIFLPQRRNRFCIGQNRNLRLGFLIAGLSQNACGIFSVYIGHLIRVPEIGICHITDLIQHHCPVQPGFYANLPAVCLKTPVIQYDKRSIYQPSAVSLGYISFGSMGKAAERLHFPADFFLRDNSLCRRLFIHHSAFHSGKPLDRFCFFKLIRPRTSDSDHNIPHILISFKIRFPGADAGKRKKALHNRKSHKRGNKGQGCRPQCFPLGFQSISGQFSLRSE